MKKSNVNKKLAGASAMLLLSASMLGTSTYAWFTMNKEVSVTNMQVKAKADQGLLINEVADYSDANWDNAATTSQTEGIQLHATSTADTKTWYVAYSTKADSAASATSGQASADLTSDGYKTLGTAPFATGTGTVAAVAGTNALQEITYVDKDADSTYDNGEGYYVKYTYYLKSSSDEITCGLAANAQSLNITDLSVTGNTASADLDKALRVAIVANGKAYIFAPLYDTAQTCYVNASTTPTTTLVGTQATAITSIPSVTTNGIPVYVYLYFEGEDANLKTQNVTATLDNLTVDFKFALIDNTTAASDNGVAVPTT
jgi:hypothetical protein